MACGGCGKAGCRCLVRAGTGIDVTGNGSAASPFMVSATGAAPAVGCGLSGDGSAGAPLSAVTGVWPFPCDLDTSGGGVYCDSSGMLRSDPRPVTDYQQNVVELNYANLAVPTAAEQEVESRAFTITNPDACREAFILLEMELDVDFTLPPGAGAMAAIADDDMVYLQNTGTSTISAEHVQTSKLFQRTAPAGGSVSVPFSVRMGRATGGATYTRIQTASRAFVFVL